MSTVTVRLNEEEEEKYLIYAKMQGVPLSTLFKQSLEQRIEDEIDMESIKEYEQKVKEGSVEYFSRDEMKKILGL